MVFAKKLLFSSGLPFNSARMSSHVTDLNACDIFLIAKLLQKLQKFERQ